MTNVILQKPVTLSREHWTVYATGSPCPFASDGPAVLPRHHRFPPLCGRGMSRRPRPPMNPCWHRYILPRRPNAPLCGDKARACDRKRHLTDHGPQQERKVRWGVIMLQTSLPLLLLPHGLVQLRFRMGGQIKILVQEIIACQSVKPCGDRYRLNTFYRLGHKNDIAHQSYNKLVEFIISGFVGDSFQFALRRKTNSLYSSLCSIRLSKYSIR